MVQVAVVGGINTKGRGVSVGLRIKMSLFQQSRCAMWGANGRGVGWVGLGRGGLFIGNKMSPTTHSHPGGGSRGIKIRFPSRYWCVGRRKTYFPTIYSHRNGREPCPLAHFLALLSLSRKSVARAHFLVDIPPSRS